MSLTTKFKDALDYIFIANDSGSSSYLISSAAAGDIASSSRVTSAISATTAAVTSSAITAVTAAAAAVATAGSDGTVDASGGAMDNLYGSVAVGLGGLLINDTLVMDVMNDTIYSAIAYGELPNGTDLNANGTANATTTDVYLAEMLQTAATSVVLGLMILITIIGNVFVIAAIILERNLQNVANYLVASLAVADLFVACLVMPLGAVYEISQGWILGPELCDIWTSCDVLCCTASILHLVAIAVDRYWAVTNIDYIHSRTSKRVFLMIICVWSAAVIVSLAPQFGWKDPDYLERIEQQKCMVSQDVAYQVFATCCTFYVPLLVILVLYWKIYQTARKRIHRNRRRPIDVTGNNNQPDPSAQKKNKRLRLRIGKFSGEKRTATTTLGLVEGNSTNTVNTVEDTEFSSSNVDCKSRAGIEVTTAFSKAEEQAPVTATSHISTVSHLVALANQQHSAAASTATPATTTTTGHRNKTHKTRQAVAITTDASAATATEESTAERSTARTATHSNRVSIVTPNEMNGHGGAADVASTNAANGSDGGADDVEVIEDPQLQQQLAQVHQYHAEAATTTTTTTTAEANSTSTTAPATTKPSSVVGGGTSASNATTITSISALSPQTPNPTTPTSVATPTAALGASSSQQLQCSSANASGQATPLPKPKHTQPLSSIANPMQKVTKRKETLEAKRERKAAKTLAIITGAFVVCWLPFFVMALMMPLCEACKINDGVAALFLWLGYFNSTLNPVIYTIFSPEFRQAFKRILFGGHRPVHYRSGKL